MKNIIIIASLILAYSCNGPHPDDQLSLENKLSGKWKAKAFTGELHEEWRLGKDGWMLQNGHYIEDNDTSYSAMTKIEEVNNEIILFSVIKNNMPKIFQAKSKKDNEIVFENEDYKNPFEVKYEFIDEGNYRRTIKGYEGDSLVSNVFNFEKIK